MVLVSPSVQSVEVMKPSDIPSEEPATSIKSNELQSEHGNDINLATAAATAGEDEVTSVNDESSFKSCEIENSVNADSENCQLNQEIESLKEEKVSNLDLISLD